MDKERLFTDFFEVAQHDPSIGAIHISLYCSMLLMASGRADEPFLFVKKEIMERAKIAGTATFSRCINELDRLGYISYTASFNFRKCSKVYFKKRDELLVKRALRKNIVIGRTGRIKIS